MMRREATREKSSLAQGRSPARVRAVGHSPTPPGAAATGRAQCGQARACVPAQVTMTKGVWAPPRASTPATTPHQGGDRQRPWRETRHEVAREMLRTVDMKGNEDHTTAPQEGAAGLAFEALVRAGDRRKGEAVGARDTHTASIRGEKHCP